MERNPPGERRLPGFVQRAIACCARFIYGGGMTCLRLALCCAIGILLCLGGSGCFPAGDSQLDEQKEPHFLTGKNRVSQMDYSGAVDSFEKALEVNPRSASAHFELGWLYEAKAGDPAAAIYHYERFLKLSPRSDNADLVKEHITTCKQQLAGTVSALGPLPQSAQRDLEKVLLENKKLNSQLAQWQAYYAGHGQIATNPPALKPGPARTNAEPDPSGTVHSGPAEPGPSVTGHPAAATVRTHAVKAGETPSAIAKKYGIPVNTLLAANPQIKPTRLQVGQILSIPGP